MFICKICGLVYPSEPSKCLNDGYKDFEEIGGNGSRLEAPSITIKFSEIQENIFPIYDFPKDILELDKNSRFYYGFKPSIREFPIKLKLSDIFKPNELKFESFDSTNNVLNLKVNTDNLDYKVLFKEKNKRDYLEVNLEDSILLSGTPTEYNIFDEVIIKNITIKFIGTK